ncbi:hypothetical protein PRZ48_005826 [Zasmidium cellare]|uniref:Uncharacterized protein n=1 Tax=Zasmidium cellare TaxID=395010 RepID=A0ABR0EML7_ZASCE|nr:hypothetical protein PRZ48_005826 [Zasmidium cellare]
MHGDNHMLFTRCKTPRPTKGHIFCNAFTSIEKLHDESASYSPIKVSDELVQILSSDRPPTIKDLMRLPTKVLKQWAVHLLIFEKDECRPEYYTGVGRDKGGVQRRFGQYDSGRCPIFIEEMIRQGYEITHRVLLCEAPAPEPGKATHDLIYTGVS